jgi:hypothetical protein
VSPSLSALLPCTPWDEIRNHAPFVTVNGLHACLWFQLVSFRAATKLPAVLTHTRRALDSRNDMGLAIYF